MSELYVNTFWTTLAAPAAAGDLTITTAAVAPVALQGGQFRVAIDSELLLVTAGQTGTTWTVTRGVEGTTAAAHATGAAVTHVLTAAGLAGMSGIEGLWVAGNQASRPKVMSVPPTLTLGNPEVLVGKTDTFVRPIATQPFRLSGAAIDDTGAGYPFDLAVEPYTPAVGWRVEFVTNADVFQCLFICTGGTVVLRVDGELVSETPYTLPNDNDLHWVAWSFQAAAVRSISLSLSNTHFLAAAVIAPYTVTAPTTPVPSRAMVVGDSFGEGVGGIGQLRGYVYRLAGLMGWDDIWNPSLGGTGYLAPGAYTKLRDRLAADVIAAAPDTLVIAVGINDHTTYTAAAIAAEAALVYSDLMTALPSLKLYVVSPWWKSSPVLPAILEMNAALRPVAEAAGATYIDAVSDPWITGSGKVTAPVGDGNADYYISSDGTHPSQAGHDYLGYRLAGSIR